jgi:hypothetical protein
MAKIWRRKKGGREVGSFHVLVKGQPLNLKTQNAREANKRASLALRGEWPDDAPARAAEVSKAAEHVPTRNPAEKAEEPQPMAAVEPPPQPAEPSPSPAAAATLAPDLPPAEPDLAAAAASAASDIVPPSPVEPGSDLAAEMGKALQREFFPEGGTAEGDIGKMGAALCLSIEHELGTMIAERKKPPRTIPEPTEQDLLFRVLKCAFGVLGRNWTGDIAIHPVWVIGIALVAYPVQMAFTARPKEIEKPEPLKAV